MDEAVQRFRRQAGRELGDREGTERRYSVGLREQAVAYWRTRARAGDGLKTVATALGVAPWSLRRWAAGAGGVGAARACVGRRDRAGCADVRVEGLDLDTAAELLARLR
jgi:hypothetical protein